MAFRPQQGQELVIEGVAYCIAEHPHAPGMPYGQEGRAGTVYRVDAPEGGRRALKVFKPRYQIPWLVSLADKLDEFVSLLGLRVCSRTVLTATRHRELIRTFPELNYAVLMPWIEGPTWMEVVLGGEAWSAEESLRFATSLVSVLARMEERRLAHCDLSGPNILLPGFKDSSRRGSSAQSPLSDLELVDVEQLYGPGLDRPDFVPTGSSGYAHKTGGSGLWSPNGDRFAGGILVAEMLGWCDQRVKENAWGESYFAPDEMQQTGSERFRVLSSALLDRWGEQIAILFESTWKSETLADCPNFGQWLAALPDHVPSSPRLSGRANQLNRSAPVSTPLSIEEETWDTASVAGLSSPGTLETPAGKPIQSATPTIRPRPNPLDEMGNAGPPRSAAGGQDAAQLVAEARRLEAMGKPHQALAYYLEAASLAPARSVMQREATGGMRRLAQTALVRKGSGSKAGVWWLMAVFALLVLSGAGVFVVYQGQVAAEITRQATATSYAEVTASVQAQMEGTANAQVSGTASARTEATKLANASVTAIALATTMTAMMPMHDGTPLPQISEAILPQNVQRIKQLAQWGQEGLLAGSMGITGIGWSPKGTWLVAETEDGVRLFDGDTLAARDISTGRLPVLSPDESLVASVDQDAKTVLFTDLRTGQIVNTLPTEQKEIESLEFSPDGTMLISVVRTSDPGDEFIAEKRNIWNIAEKRLILSIDELDHQTSYSFLISPDSQHLLAWTEGSYSYAYAFKAWRLPTGDPDQGIMDRFASTTILGISKDVSTIIVLEKDRSLVVRRFEDGNVISHLQAYTMKEDENSLPRVTLSPKGKWAIVADKMWRVADGKVVLTQNQLDSETSKGNFLELDFGSFDDSDKFRAIAEQRYDTSAGMPLGLGTVFLYDLSSMSVTVLPKDPLQTMDINGGGYSQYGPTFRPDGTGVYAGWSGSGRGRTSLWSVPHKKLVGGINMNIGFTFGLRFSSDTTLVTTDLSQVRLLEATSGKLLGEKENPVSLDVLLTDEKVVLSGGYGYTILSGLDLDQSPTALSVPPRGTCGSGDPSTTIRINLSQIGRSSGAFALSRGQLAREVDCYDHTTMLELLPLTDTSQLKAVLKTVAFPESTFNGLKISPDGSFLVVGQSRELHLLGVPDLTQAHILQIPSGEIQSFEFSPDGSLIAASASDGALYLWQVKDGEVRLKIETSATSIGQVTFSPDGDLIAVVAGSEVQLWQTDNGKLLHSVTVPNTVLLAFSPNGKLLATASRGGVIRIWGIW